VLEDGINNDRRSNGFIARNDNGIEITNNIMYAIVIDYTLSKNAIKRVVIRGTYRTNVYLMSSLSG